MRQDSLSGWTGAQQAGFQYDSVFLFPVTETGWGKGAGHRRVKASLQAARCVGGVRGHTVMLATVVPELTKRQGNEGESRDTVTKAAGTGLDAERPGLGTSPPAACFLTGSCASASSAQCDFGSEALSAIKERCVNSDLSCRTQRDLERRLSHWGPLSPQLQGCHRNLPGDSGLGRVTQACWPAGCASSQVCALIV